MASSQRPPAGRPRPRPGRRPASRHPSPRRRGRRPRPQRQRCADRSRSGPAPGSGDRRSRPSRGRTGGPGLLPLSAYGDSVAHDAPSAAARATASREWQDRPQRPCPGAALVRGHVQSVHRDVGNARRDDRQPGQRRELAAPGRHGQPGRGRARARPRPRRPASAHSATVRIRPRPSDSCDRSVSSTSRGITRPSPPAGSPTARRPGAGSGRRCGRRVRPRPRGAARRPSRPGRRPG